MNLNQLFENTNSGGNYAEDLAKQVFDANPNIHDENQILDAAWPLAVTALGNKRAMSVFNYDADFPSDLVSVYGWLQKDQQGIAEEQLSEIGNTPAGRAALGAVQNRAYDKMDAWSANPTSGYSSTPKDVSKATGAGVAAGNRLHGFGPDNSRENTVMARDALRQKQALSQTQGMAEDTPRFDPLVDKIAAKMKGPTENDAIAALITVLGTSAYNERPGFYRLWLGQAIDKYSQQGVAEDGNKEPAPNSGLALLMKKRAELAAKKESVAEGSNPEKVEVRISGREYAAMSPEQKAAKQQEWQQLKQQAKMRMQNFTLIDTDKEQGVAEGEEHSPVAGAITRRIMSQRVDLLSKYGPEKVLNAIDEVADFVGDVEEIGSSDVSGWVRQVEQTLGQMEQGLGEAGQKYHANTTGFARGARDDERHDLDRDTQTWYIRLNGKLIRDKQGNPYSYRGKAAANKAALTMQAKLFNKGKEFVLTTNPNDPQQGVAESTEKRCMQCGMKNCKCPGDSCKCKPIAGWVPGKGFKKAVEEAAIAKKKELSEFAPPGGDDREPDEEHILKQLASQWWLGTEQQMAKAQRTLASMGWEIGQDESGDDDAGVFLIRPGDVNGDTYIAFPHSELELNEAWSQKYKNSINCSHPKGFSQRAHCAGKKKHNESTEMEMVCEDCGMCQTHGNINEIKKGQKDANGYTRCWPGKHAEGTKKGKNGGQVRNCVPNESITENQLKPSNLLLWEQAQVAASSRFDQHLVEDANRWAKIWYKNKGGVWQ